MESDTSSRSVALVTVVVTAAVLLAVVALVLVTVVRGQSSPGAGPSDASSGSSTASEPETAPRVARVSVPQAVRAVAALRDWDAARAAAWAARDVAGLRSLYVAGAPAGARDVAMLRRWTARGLRVEGMAMQVFEVQLRVRTDRRLVMLVTDRLAAAVAVRGGGSDRWDLPRDRASTRLLEFRRTGGHWRLRSAYDRPLARTASTSGSATS